MSHCFAYTRVSTVKQGEHGVSLQEQRAAIEAYASRRNITITAWFEDMVTAAKLGRPLFLKMLKQLRKGEADGVVIHKIDRSARNLRDWADLGELIDSGVAVHFANESLDLLSRGGRLAADIQAVVAADYVRNLREETKKGMYGRLKQGLYPLRAPIGYVDNGKGKAKTAEPVQGPLVQQAFELYASGQYSLKTLRGHLHQHGLRNRRGNAVSLTGLSTILNNSFYTGLIRMKKTGETFPGAHAPLVSMALFQDVQARLSKRTRVLKWTHDFSLRGLFKCRLCGQKLRAERQKGHAYYRCHTQDCATRCFREELLEDAMFKTCPVLATEEEFSTLVAQIQQIERLDQAAKLDASNDVQMRLSAVRERLSKLTDALIDGVLDKPSFEERRHDLLQEQQALSERLGQIETEEGITRAFLVEVVELASNAQQSYRSGNAAFRREIANRLWSNLQVAGKEVFVEPRFPLLVIAERRNTSSGAPYRCTCRTSFRTAWRLWSWAKRTLKAERDRSDADVA